MDYNISLVNIRFYGKNVRSDNALTICIFYFLTTARILYGRFPNMELLSNGGLRHSFSGKADIPSCRITSDFGFRPLYFPAALALRTPSIRRINIICRSDWAMPPKTVSNSFPVGIRVSISKFRIRSPAAFCSRLL
jgi:hypothetical protein